MNHILRKRTFYFLLTILSLTALVLPLAMGVTGTALAQGDVTPLPDALTTTQCFVPEADTYAWDYFGSNRDGNYGDAGTLDVSALGDVQLDRRYSFMRFNLDDLPDNAVVRSAALEMYLSGVDVSGAQTYTVLEAVEEAWSETTLTWNNQPDRTNVKYDELTVTDSAGWKTWDATALASEWVRGRRDNHGLAVVSLGLGSPPAHFYSREGSTTLAPRLCVEWVEYTNVLDPDNVGWRSGRNYGSSAFGDWFRQLSDQDYMIVDIEVDEIDGAQRVGGVWQRNTDGRAWRETRNMSLATFEDLQEERADAGYRMIDQEVYVLGSSTYYAGIWIDNTENLEWVNYYDVSSSEFASLFDQYSASGYLIIDVDAYVIDGALLYSAIWVDNVENLDWRQWRNLSSQEFAEKFDAYYADYRMIDVESYRFGGQQYYAGIWVENKDGRGWAEWRNMTSKAFGEKWAELRDAGYRLIDYEVYPTASGWRYAGIWRQNGDRPAWSLKGDVDTLLQDYFDDADLSGMSIAIAQNGRFRYLRGFGHADVDDDVATDSRTIYRLASVSKAVAGVLGLRLEEQGLIDLSDDSRDYVSELPAHHTHSVSQTLSNRSGIGHYDDYPSIVDAYTTALDAARELWDFDLVYTPGQGYKYSTHAYTFAGAAMEGAVGVSLRYILEDYLQLPYNLDTLRAEDRSLPNPKRALLYNANNEEVSADDLSWKVLGGGMEASAYDLARFGIQLNDGALLTEASRTQLWTPPDARRNYALGWDTGADRGSPVVAKGGAQNGARSYIRIYPDEDIVIVILSNRRQNHNPTALGRSIGALMLEELDASAFAIALQPQQALDATQEEIDEPESEGLPAEYVVWPVSNPVAGPAPEDLQEPAPVAEAPVYFLYLPLSLR